MQTNLENSSVVIKNVVLYDPWQYVCGFAELRTSDGVTVVKVRHNLADDLLMALTHNGKTYTFELTSKNQVFDLDKELDLEKEILICIMQKEANQITTLASGILNHNPKQELPLPEVQSNKPTQQQESVPLCSSTSLIIKPTRLDDIIEETDKNKISRETPLEDHQQFKTQAAREIDQLLRQVCKVDDQNRGICESCPYRDHFYGDGL